ncbi:MAG: CapA family protein, partial [Solirubrobacterales bacterium]
SLDQGLDGIRTTEKALKKAGVAQTGSASSPSRQRRPLILKAKGVSVGVLAYTTSTNGIPLPAPWSVNLAAPERILADARRLRRRGAEVVLVNVHWGDEDSTEINAEQQGIAEVLTRSRAVTAVVGQGPHVVQPIRRLNGRPVVFSEGNLLSNQTPGCCAPGSQDGLIGILEVTVRRGRDRLTDVDYVPTWVRHPDFTVLPLGRTARSGEAPRATLTASYERTVSVAGRAKDVHPVPRKRP